MANDSLQQAKRVKNDEFYTVYDGVKLIVFNSFSLL